MKKILSCLLCPALLLLAAGGMALTLSADGDPYAVVSEEPVHVVPDEVPMAGFSDPAGSSVSLPENGGVSAADTGEVDPFPAQGKLSPAFDHLAAEKRMIKTGLCASDVHFTETDFKQSLGLGSLDAIVVTKVPDPLDGKLTVGSMTVSDGQTVRASLLSLLTFTPASGEVTQTSFRFTGGEGSSGAELCCTVKLIDSVNHAPVFADDGGVFPVIASVGVPVTGVLPADDPEGDALYFEVTSYPSHGTVTLSDPAVGAFCYSPAQGYSGTDGFRYVAYDCYGNCTPEREVCLTVSGGN